MDINQPVPTIYGNQYDQFKSLWEQQIAKLKERFPSDIEEVRMPRDYPTDVPILYVRKSGIVPVLQAMKEASGLDYQFLSDITATDEEINPRFEVVYNLFSHVSKARIRVKVRLNEGEKVPTIVSLWNAANWAEREVFDMYGVEFEGHPDLRRILMDERWQGHPLRKDYPLRGYQIFPEAQSINEKLLED
jgi:NADH-quinone oxidoreductase subunit C